MNLFSRNKPPAGTAGALPDGAISPELQARVLALQSRNATLRTSEDAVAVAQEAGAIVGELFKSLEAASKKRASKTASSSAPDPDPVDDYDPDAEGFDPSSVDDGGEGDEPEGDEPEAPAQPVRRPAPRSGGKGKFAKSLEALSQNDPVVATALSPLFESIEASEQSGAVTNHYLEQLGGLLSKSLEGMSVIAENQNRLAERLDALDAKIDERSAETAGLERANFETLQKSLEPMIGFVQNARQSPRGTPLGRVAVPDAAISAPTLGDAVPAVQNATEKFNGFTRPELKKSMEGAVRSGRYLSKGLNVSHFNMVAGEVPLSELPPIVYEVASAELKRPLPVAPALAGDDE